MVYYFTTKCGTTLYMGKDKYENEDLIRYGHPEDVWFHVDNLSSAHVYLRMKPGMTLDDLTEDQLLACSSLVKANSIQGCKNFKFVFNKIEQMPASRKTVSMWFTQDGKI
mmetsp:Transcript_823/g.1282  ORF Transcript_823/g.1282 Transcript_823/m.1282 type:complete len:110 (+) Transcript_823:44-373(+)